MVNTVSTGKVNIPRNDNPGALMLPGIIYVQDLYGYLADAASLI